MLQMGNDPEEVRRLREDWAAQGNALPAPDPDPSATAARRAHVLGHVLKETD
jgi:hypothetical protein